MERRSGYTIAWTGDGVVRLCPNHDGSVTGLDHLEGEVVTILAGVAVASPGEVKLDSPGAVVIGKRR